MTSEVAEVFALAMREPLVPLVARAGGTMLDQAAIKIVIPHREPFLFVDRVVALDLHAGLIAARYDLTRSADTFAAHFPGLPLWPGVLHVEAITQAAAILYFKHPDALCPTRLSLTHILAARYMQPVGPGGDVEIIAKMIDHDLFVTAVGQCLQNGEICSVAAIKMLP